MSHYVWPPELEVEISGKLVLTTKFISDYVSFINGLRDIYIQ